VVAVSGIGAILAVFAVLCVEGSTVRVNSTDRAAEGGGRPADGSSSRPSKNNRHGGSQHPETTDSDLRPCDLPDDAPGLRPIAVKPETKLREEAAYVEMENGMRVPLTDGTAPEPDESVRGRPVYRVLNEFREWYRGYLNAHIEYDSPDGETVRTRLENSYQPEYAKRYYAKLKDFERGIRRRFDGDPKTAMLTFTASHLNDQGGQRCPADHMREIAEGWRLARKHLYPALDGQEWEYARIWEPHENGYGHLHVAIFADGELRPEMFEPVMSNYVGNVTAAGSEAHAVRGEDSAVSINDDVENLGSYISEYLGAFGESILDRPISEQMFHAVTWATNTRRLDFSNGAQEIIRKEKFRRDTGLNPDTQVGGQAYERYKAREAGETGGESGSGGSSGEDAERGDGGDEWGVSAVCYVHGAGRREYADPTSGGVDTAVIDGRPGMDPPAKRS